MSAWTKERHRAYGLHSNIPECCVDAWVAIHDDDNSHIWHAELRCCVGHDDCTYVPAGAQMNMRGLPELECGYVPCERCHRDIAAGIRKANKLHVCSNRSLSCREFHPNGVGRALTFRRASTEVEKRVKRMTTLTLYGAPND
jgi:hypothetical protein